jgi:regulator of protease activity HflC (stomatin/prohibitin superfamily)
MSTVLNAPTLGPGAQAVRLAFWFIVAIALLAAGGWATSNIRRIPADSRAVVMRLGTFVRSQDAGLLLAWPQPFDKVLLIPGSARMVELRINSLDRDPRARATDSAIMTESSEIVPLTLGDVGSPELEVNGAAAADADPSLSDALAGSGYVPTGDNGVVHLSATLFYRVVDPYAYALQQEQLNAALQRIAAAAVVEVTAARDLDSILVARPELLSTHQRVATGRAQLRSDITQAVQRHLMALDAAHTGLGIEIARTDVQAQFPTAAVDAFNSVLSSLQTADRNIAQARTQAENIRQTAQQTVDQILQSAQASASERVATARAETSTILQLETPLDANQDQGLLARTYRDRIEQILPGAGRITTIDPHNTSSLVLPGKMQ